MNLSGRQIYCSDCKKRRAKECNSRKANKYYHTHTKPKKLKEDTRPRINCEKCGKEVIIYKVQRTMCGACARTHGWEDLRAKADEAKAEGNCVICFKKNDREGKLYCSKCAVIKSKATSKRYKYRKDNKLCQRCEKPLEANNKYTECFDCRAKAYGEDKKYGTTHKPKFYINENGKKVYYSQIG